MKGKARDWHDNRACQLRSNRKIDTSSAFVSAMDSRITTSHDRNVAYAKIQRVKYKGSVMTCVNKLIRLNENANMSGDAWHTVFVNNLVQQLRNDLANMHGGKLM